MARQSLIPGRVKNTGIDLVITAAFIGGGILAVGFLNKRFGILNKLVTGAGSLGFKVGEATGLGLKSIPQGIIAGTLGIPPEVTNANLKSNLTLTPLPNDPLFGENGVFTNLWKSINPGDKNYPSDVIPKDYGEESGNNQKQGGFSELITAIEKNPIEDTTRNLASGETFKTFQSLFKDIQPATNISSTPKQALDVAKIIKQAGQRLTAAQVQATSAKTPQRNLGFGGFGTANRQETTLQALIAANAKRYPQYFKVA